MSGPVEVLAILNEAQDWLYRSSESKGDDARAESVEQARATVAELIEADREHDAARIALVDLNQHIAGNGWIDVEFDALRIAGERFVRAQIRRDRALANIGGAE